MKKKCFVIAPIGEEDSEVRKRSDQIFEYAIKPAAIEYGYEVGRADHISSPGMITSQIIDRLLNDDLVIADLTYKNPNIFYELAIRHSAEKPVIQIKEYSETIPFDITNMRTIDVDYRFFDKVNICKEEIKRQIKSIEENKNNDNYVSNPIAFAKLLNSPQMKDETQNKIIKELLLENERLKTTNQGITDKVEVLKIVPDLYPDRSLLTLQASEEAAKINNGLQEELGAHKVEKNKVKEESTSTQES